MSRITLFPTLEEALFLHQRLLEAFGGAPGVRDPGLLESALARPRSGYYSSLAEQAAALMQSLAMNHHCFIDGNKRVAFALTDVFLRLNGHCLTVKADSVERFLIRSVIEAKAELAVLTDWIGQHVKKLP
jgi:death-on-curing protein